jgi:glycosyltransferase involved in cell wall biosynthesis
MLLERHPPDIGGLARSGARISATIASLGIDVDIVAWTRQLPPGTLESSAVGQHISLHRVGLFAGWDLSLQHTLNILEWLHEKRQFQAVWGHYLFPAGFLAVTFGELNRMTSLVSARGNDVDRLMFPPGDFARLQWTLDRATTVTAVSKELSHKIELVSRPGRAVELLPNVVDLDIFYPASSSPNLREKLGIRADEIVLGFSGELRHKKGIDFLLPALTRVRKERPAVLLVIGDARQEGQAKLASYASEFSDDAARIIITGHLENPTDVAEHLNLCDIYLQPSMWEGMPNALLEAMACGHVVIASDAGGIPEVIEHQVSGFVLAKQLLNHLGEAILEVLSLSPEQRHQIGQSARRRIETEFHPQVEAAALSRILEGVIPRTSS